MPEPAGPPGTARGANRDGTAASVLRFSDDARRCQQPEGHQFLPEFVSAS